MTVIFCVHVDQTDKAQNYQYYRYKINLSETCLIDGDMIEPHRVERCLISSASSKDTSYSAHLPGLGRAYGVLSWLQTPQCLVNTHISLRRPIWVLAEHTSSNIFLRYVQNDKFTVFLEGKITCNLVINTLIRIMYCIFLAIYRRLAN